MSENATCPVAACPGQTGNKTLPAKMIVVGCLSALSSQPGSHSHQATHCLPVVSVITVTNNNVNNHHHHQL